LAPVPVEADLEAEANLEAEADLEHAELFFEILLTK
jgi:hypothetical protein